MIDRTFKLALCVKKFEAQRVCWSFHASENFQTHMRIFVKTLQLATDINGNHNFDLFSSYLPQNGFVETKLRIHASIPRVT